MLTFVDNLQFRTVNNEFQTKLRKDVNRINQSNNIFVHADKTRNIYQMTPDSYDKLLLDNITQKYKTAEQKLTNEINSELNSIADTLDISDRIDPTANKPVFLTLKDRKENFKNSPKARDS